MLYQRVAAMALVGIIASISHAFAQDCDRYQWACQGWSAGPRSPVPPSRAPLQVVPVPPPDTRDAVVQPVQPRDISPPLDPRTAGQYASLYAGVDGEPFPIPALRLTDVDPAYLRREVSYPTGEQPGTIVVDPHSRYLYLVLGGGRAMRYGVGVGREGFGWSGVATVHDKQEWPDWYPPKEMLQRQPELMRHMRELRGGIGMPGGPGNPLGARAMYLWQGNKDTLFRIHGTVEPWTIGRSVSSGCIRMINQDAIDLYKRVEVGAKVVVLSSSSAWR
jgi:lipoprotein-anchoring transpeptidase ErfK/SrfK